MAEGIESAKTAPEMMTFREEAVRSEAQERVPADCRYCFPLWLQRRCLRHRQRFHVSSSLYLQSAEWRTKIVITGVVLMGRTLAQNQHKRKATFLSGFVFCYLVLAERVGFEPTLEFPLNTLSKRAPSATRPPLRSGTQVGTR